MSQAQPLQNFRDNSQTVKKPNPQNELARFLEKNKAQFTMALPKHLNPDRMMRLTLTAFSQNKKLRECDMGSIFAGVVIASQMGLEIGVQGQGFLVPYKGKAQFVPGWQGLVDLVNRSGRASVWTGAVFAGDEFDYALGDRPFVTHRPGGEDDPSMMTHVYAVGRVNGSEWPVIEVWPIKRVWKHRDKNNKVGSGHYSYENQEMYARKVPLLQVIKYMPKSIELSNALAAEHAFDQGKGIVMEGEFIRTEDQDDNQQVDRSTGEVTRNDQPALGLADAIAAADAGDIETAQDIGRSLSLRDRDSLEAYLNKPEAAPVERPAPRQRQARNIE